MDKLHSKMVYTNSITADKEDLNKEESLKALDMEKNFASAFWTLAILFGIIIAVLYLSMNTDLNGTFYESPAVSSSVNSNYAEMQEEIEEKYSGDLYEYVKANIGKVQK